MIRGHYRGFGHNLILAAMSGRQGERDSAGGGGSKGCCQFGLRSLLLGFVVCALVLGYVVHRSRESDRRRVGHACYQVLLALAVHSQSRGRLPPAVHLDQSGRAISSWRFQLCPNLIRFRSDTLGGYQPVLNAPWDSPANKLLRDAVWVVFSQRPRGKLAQTNVMAITGPGTAFDEGRPWAMDELPADTILLAEVRDSGVHWMAPGDLDIRTMPRKIGDPRGISGVVRGGFHVGFADLSVWCLRDDTPFAAVEKFFTIEGAAAHDRESVLGPHRLDTIGVRQGDE